MDHLDILELSKSNRSNRSWLSRSRSKSRSKRRGKIDSGEHEFVLNFKSVNQAHQYAKQNTGLVTSQSLRIPIPKDNPTKPSWSKSPRFSQQLTYITKMFKAGTIKEDSSQK